MWDIEHAEYVANSGLATNIALDGPRNRLAVVSDYRNVVMITIYELKLREEMCQTVGKSFSTTKASPKKVPVVQVLGECEPDSPLLAHYVAFTFIYLAFIVHS